jgi:hypothetical protein
MKDLDWGASRMAQFDERRALVEREEVSRPIAELFGDVPGRLSSEGAHPMLRNAMIVMAAALSPGD